MIMGAEWKKTKKQNPIQLKKTKQMSNRVTHFEIPSDDPEKSMKFFRDVFGWTFQQFGTETYWMAMSGDEKTPGINGAIMKKRDANQPIVNSIMVAGIDEYIKKIERSGGKIVVPKMAIPRVGWLSYFTDPDGNIHGIWQNDPEAK
jgi:predicted enzyme related to lactoylglutathione lyase